MADPVDSLRGRRTLMLATQSLKFHYHDVEEWLQVRQGEMSFVSAKGHIYRVEAGRILEIPRGEVHRVEIGPSGVEYQMWLPVSMPDSQSLIASTMLRSI